MIKVPRYAFAPMLAIIALFAGGINSPAFAKTTVLMAYGDSLTSGLGLQLAEAFPAQLEARLKEKGHDVRVINAGVSGETSSGAKARLDWTLSQTPPDALILETGANDMLRGVEPAITRANIAEILKVLKDRKIPVLLTGMRAFAGMGLVFGRAYGNIYPGLADEYGALYYPFFLEGVAMDAALNQPDGMHPNAAGVKVIVDNILPDVEKLLK